MRHNRCPVEIFPFRISPNPPLKIVCELRGFGEELFGRQEFCEQGAAMGICMRASGTLVLYFYMLMQRDNMGILFVELEEGLRNIDRALFIVEGEIWCIRFCAKYRIDNRNVYQNEFLMSDDIALYRIN